MAKPEDRKWPDGTKVRFTDQAMAVTNWAASSGSNASVEELARGRRRIVRSYADKTFTVRNTDDNLHDVILDNGERWGMGWLEEIKEARTSLGLGTSIHYDPNANTIRTPRGDGAFNVEYDLSTNVLCGGGLMVPVLASQFPENVDCGQCRRRKAFPG
ncbi:hypothetical protein [Agromyces humi]|uniref:hypothetical protein n=1 Tax=Agromyces humi TaxID=1766800 RepID=UPI0013592E4D|nr:hypothetical protein [Agromyces humi]